MSDFRIVLDTAASGDLEKANQQLAEYIDKLKLAERESRAQGSTFQKAYSTARKELQDTTLAIQQAEKASKSRTTSEEQQLASLRQKQQQLTGEVRDYVQVQESVKEAITKQVTTTNGLLEQQRQKFKDLKKSIQEAKSEYDLKQANAELQRTQEEIKRLTQLGRGWRNSTELVENSYTGLVQRNKELRQLMNKLPITDTTGELSRLQREFKSNTDALKKFDAELGQSFRNVGNYEGAIKNAGKGLAGFGGSLGGVGKGGAGLGGALSAGLSAVPALAGVAVVGAGLDQGLQALQQINDQLRLTQNLTKLQGQSLNNLVGDIRALEKVYDQDYNETLRATNVLMENFGLTGTASIDLINQGLLQGADINGDYLDQLSEYAVQFKAAGLNAQQLNNIIIAGADKGIFSDKAADAVKEGTLRLREMTKATKEAITGIGLNADEIERRLATGEANIGDILSEISTALATLPAQSRTVGTAIADIFGGAGEDAGLPFLLTLKDINQELDASSAQLTDYQKSQLAYVDSQREMERALVSFGTAFGPVGDSISTFSNQVITGLINSLVDMGNSFRSTESIIAQFNEGIKEASAAELKEQLADLKKEASALNEEIGTFSLTRFLSSFGNGAVAVAQQNKEMAELAEKMAIVRKRLSLSDNQEETTQEIEKSIPPVKQSAAELEKLARSAQEAATNIDKVDGSGLSTEATRMNQDLRILQQAWEAAFGEPFTEDLVANNARMLQRIDKEIRDSVRNYQDAERAKSEALEVEMARRRELREVGLDTLTSVTDSGFEVFNNGLQREIFELEAAEQFKLQVAKDNEVARQRIQENTARKRAQLMREQARNEKAAALFNIAINTARAVIQALPNVPLSIIVGAAGVAAGVAVATRPIPSYRRGRKSGPAELAYIGEEGAELVWDKRKDRAYLADRPQLAMLPHDAAVLTAQETKTLLKESPQIFRQSTTIKRDAVAVHHQAQVQQLLKGQNSEMLARSIGEELSLKLTRALDSRPVHRMLADERGFRRFIDKGHSRIEILNRRNSFGGEN